jgi:hypothetical protein
MWKNFIYVDRAITAKINTSEFMYRLFEGDAEIGFIALPTFNIYCTSSMYVCYKYMFYQS